MLDDPTPNPLTPGESELESALARLAPQPAAPDRRETIAYEAGRRAGRRAATPWRLSTATLAACLVAIAVLPRATPTPPIPAPLATATSPPPASPPPRVATMTPAEFRPTPGTYLALRDEVLANGLDALPPGTGGGGSADPRSVPHAIDFRNPSPQLPTLFGGRS